MKQTPPNKQIKEDAPVNSVGSGNVAGVGITPEGKPDNWGELGVSKKHQKKRTRILRRKTPLMEIQEVQVSKKKRFNLETGKPLGYYYRITQKISDIGKTHELHRSVSYPNFYVVRKKGKIVDATVSGSQNNRSKTFSIHTTDSTGKGPKLHDVYHHLLKHAGVKTIVSDHSQSEGGKKIWQKLAKKRSVSVYGVDKNNQLHNLDPNKEEDHEEIYGDDEHDDFQSPKSEPETHQALKMRLAATLKPTKRNVKSSLKEDEVRRGKFAGYDTFIVPSEHFQRARNAKQSGQHWSTYIGEDDYGSAIREYANKYPKKGIILQCERTGAMCFARYSKEK